MKIVIGIITLGRPKTIKILVDVLQQQTRKADVVYICPVGNSDVSTINFDKEDKIRVFSKKGAAAQRNAILKEAKNNDVIVFFDDDFIPSKNYLEAVEELFTQDKSVVISTGEVIKDGAKNEGIEFNEAQKLINTYEVKKEKREEFFSAYGCNMAIRLKTVFDNAVFFDENLPLYSWLEDLDFTQRIKKHGSSVKINTSFGVHLAEKKGRTSGVKFGYSQIANPLYIASKKHSFTHTMAIKMIMKNIVANSLKYFFSESFIDRKGRFKGNFLAIKDLILKKIDPKNILHL